MKISVIVPAFNEEKLLPATLESIRTAFTSFDKRGWEREMIVCDNNSTDRTADVARRAGAMVVFEPVNQIGRARNTGAAGASGDWLLFIDADSRPSAELFADLADCVEADGCLAGGSTVVLDASSFWLGLLVRWWNAVSRLKKLAPGSFIFCRAEAFRAVGGFHAELYVAEEIDLFQRLHRLAHQRGQRIVILHRHPLVTSARKVRLYSLREHLSFLCRMALSLGRGLKDPKACFPWYDGRR